MSKIWWIVGVLVLVVGGVWAVIGFRWWFESRSQPTPLTSPEASTPETTQPTLAPDKTYQDAAGLSFQYPGDLVVADDTPDDGRHYTLLTLKRTSEQMKIIVRDTEFTTVDKWLTSDRDAPKNPTLVGPITLGDIEGRQVTASGKRYSIAIKDGILYEITSIDDKGLWSLTHQRILDTLAFVTPKPATGSSGSQSSTSSDEVIYEAEEVVE